ncbi:MAG: DsrE family protein [Burkholderiales bacterium]|nr:DsrE family protein [Burkholderiales bacterium]
MNKRNAAAGLLALSLVVSGCAATQGMVGPDKVVYHINNTEAQASDALRNIGNHLEVNPQARIVVVTHARGVDFLMHGAKDATGKPYQVAVEQLKLRGVKFDVCEITLRNRNLTKDRLTPDATFVPSGVAEITRLQQREGFAYLRP